jgi:hypothetical protein
LKLAIAIIIVAGTGCARPDAGPGNLHDQLQLGRKVAYSETGSAAGFGLTDDDSIVGSEMDIRTGAVSHVLFDTTKSARTDFFTVDRHCRDTAASMQERLLIDADELTPARKMLQRIADGMIAVTWNRSFNGLPVRDAYFQCIYNDRGDGSVVLRELVNRTHGGVPVANTSAVEVDFSAVAARSGRRLTLLATERLIYPKPDLSGDVGLWYATAFTARDEDSDEDLTVTVASDDGTVLEAFSNRYHATYAVEGDTFERTYLGSTRKARTIPLLDLTVDGASMQADADGEVSVNNPVTVSARLQSSRVRVVNAAAGNSQVMTVPASVAGDDIIRLNPDANGLIGLNGMMAVLRINEFVRRHLTEAQAQILGQSMTLNINVSGNCNAFYNGNISMFMAGNGCENTALINDIIYHEWGHGLDNFTGTNGGITDGAFSEGIGDIISGFYTGDPNLAPGFFSGNATGIRNLKNTRRFPTDQGEVHLEGQIIGGAFWDLREALIKRFGAVKGAYQAESLFFNHLLTTDSYRDSYTAVLRLDDNDGNPATKSPNHCLINAAFAAHGLATAENCTDSPASDTYQPGDLVLTLVPAADTAFLASGQGAHYMLICFDGKLTCITGKRRDMALTRDGTIGELMIFSGSTNRPLNAKTEVTLIAEDEYGKVISARTFRLMDR